MAFNLAVRFLLEVCVLVALAYWGFRTGQSPILKLSLGIGAPVFIAIIWGMFGSPQAQIPVSNMVRFLLELGIFLLAVIALIHTGRHIVAAIFAMLIVVNQILSRINGQ